MDAFPSNQPHWRCGHHGLDDGRASALHPQDRKAPAQSDEARAGNDHWNLAPREICRWDKQDEQDGGKCGSDCVRLDEPDSLMRFSGDSSATFYLDIGTSLQLLPSPAHARKTIASLTEKQPLLQIEI